MEAKPSLEKSEATHRLEFDIFSSESQSLTRTDSNSFKKLLIKLTPFTSKYKEIWKRVRMKLKFKKLIVNFMKSEQFISTTSQTVLNKKDFVKKKAGYRAPTEVFTNIESKEPFMIHPKNVFRSFWNCVISLLLLYTATVMPFSMAFYESDSQDAWFIIDIVMNALFLMDVLITFNSAYYDNCGVLISDRKTVCLRYLKSWFIIDFFSCIPFNLISGGGKSYNNLLRLARLPRLAKLLRLSRLLKVLKTSASSSFLGKIEDVLNIKTSAMRLFQGFMTAIILVHLMACLWFYAAKFQDFDVNTWVVKFGFMDLGVGSLYLRSVYFIITTLATVGYGDIYPCNDLERFIVIIWIIVVMFFMTFNISSMSSLVSNIDTKESILKYKISVIEDFCKENKLSKDLRIRLKESLKYSTEQNGGSLYNKQELILQLPNKLRYEVALAMHKGYARDIQFFQQFSKAFVSSVIPLLISQCFRKGNLIYKENDHPDEVYFIVKGRVGFVFGSQLTVFQNKFKGDCFGFYEIFLSTHRIFSTKAELNTELMTLKKNLLLDALKQYPVVEQELRNMIEAEKVKTLRNYIEFKVILELRRNGRIKEMDLIQLREYIDSRFKDYQKAWRGMELKEVGIEDLALTCETLKGKINALSTLYSEAQDELTKLCEKII